MPSIFEKLGLKKPKEIKEVLDPKYKVELDSCTVAIRGLEKLESAWLTETDTPKLIQTKRFGEVKAEELTVRRKENENFVFIRSSGDLVKYQYIRIPYKKTNSEVSCLKPEYFLDPAREITEADLFQQNKWVQPFNEDGKLALVQFAHDVLDQFHNQITTGEGIISE